MSNPMVNFRDIIAKDSQNGFNVHDSLKDKTVEELQKIQMADTLPFAVCVLNLTGDLNVGTILRSACLFGAQEFIIFGRRKFDIRSCVGAQNYIPVTKIAGLTDDLQIDEKKFHEMMLEKNLFPIFVETGGVSLWDVEWCFIPTTATPCLIFGNETNGIPKSLMTNCLVVSIPQKGVLRSFNVSSAAAITMWEFTTNMFGE